jgi:hypothetical protein
MDLKVPGIILAVTGLIALIVSLTKGPNLGMSRRTGVAIALLLLVLGAGLMVYSVVAQ